MRRVHSGEIMEIHHTKHHATYVNNFNATLEKIEAAQVQFRFLLISLRFLFVLSTFGCNQQLTLLLLYRSLLWRRTLATCRL